jgi:hypothetical protein
MTPYDKGKARLERALILQNLGQSVRVKRIVGNSKGGDYTLLFPDGRKAIGTFQELIVNVKEATSAELLMAFCDLDELLTD